MTLFIIFLLLILILYCSTFKIKWSKQDVAKSYGICRKTLGKWVKYCSPNIDYEKWQKARKLNVLCVLFIFYEFGIPDENEILTKGEIAEKCDSDYQTLRETIALNLEKLGLQKEAYLSLDIFPPKLSLKMVELMG